MPLPKPRKSQSKKAFLESCLSDPTVNKDFPDTKQRYAVCLSQFDRKRAKASYVVATANDEYIYMATKLMLSAALVEKAKSLPQSDTGKHSVIATMKSGKKVKGIVSNCEEFETDEDEEIEDDEVMDIEMEDAAKVDMDKAVFAAKNEGKTLNKPFRLPKGSSKKFGVYVKNEKGNVVVVKFGDPNMEIKRDDPERRKNFQARHGCDNPGPKTGARYWSCLMWRSKPVSQITSSEEFDWNNLTEIDLDNSVPVVEEDES